MRGKLQLAYDVWRHFGVRWSGYRVWYALSRKSGFHKRRFPTGGWEAHPLGHWLRSDIPAEPEAYRAYRSAHRPAFFFEPGRLPTLPETWRGPAIEAGREILAGRPRFFSHERADLGFPFDWLTNPFTGQRAAADRHWCDRSDFEADQGDIKFIWEQSRFAWVYDLARAYAASGDERCAAAFWQLLESWRGVNPPNIGPHWQCGQECSFRVMALCFALHAFWAAESTSAERVAMLTQTVAALGERIAGNINYARSQQNNHAISEALGLYTVGTLFPECRAAGNWRAKGKRLLQSLALQQIFDDGAYIQHSFNYHRLMLHDYLWVLRLAELNHDAFDRTTKDRVQQATEFLYQVQDASGRVPNYGPNDGALILPLDSCAYLDYRPIIQAMTYQLTRTRRYESGPWDESLLWLFGTHALDAPVQDAARSSQRLSSSGYYTLRQNDSWALTRCHTYRTRPGHADSLHVDLWWRGVNVLRDAGSYLYNAAPEWKDYFPLSRAHNTLTVDDHTHMERGPRFMWRHWMTARAPTSAASATQTFTGIDTSYRKRCGVTHQRRIEALASDHWRISDDISGAGTHKIAFYWHLADGSVVHAPDDPFTWTLKLPAGTIWLRFASPTSATVRLVRGQEAPLVQGWESLYYGTKQAQPTLVWTINDALPLTLVTEIGLGRDLGKRED